ncbi:MAG: hypothetical protein E6Q36_08200 [Chryseobacterium sp.]|nr:MAG: hypothetical protein E6Q36_08200 [Chryseobacterium sp.]
MDSRTASIKINLRLEKLDSSDYTNITRHQKEEAVNKAVLDLVRFDVKTKDELNRFSIDDLQILLKEQNLSIVNKDLFVETVKFPSDYLFFKLLTPKCSKGDCSNVYIKSTLIEAANVDEWLQDYSSQPSFDFEETFHTLVGNKYRVYHNKDFQINEVKLLYYRKPVKISFSEADNTTIWEWKDDLAELIIDRAVQILASDTENQSVYQTASQRAETLK